MTPSPSPRSLGRRTLAATVAGKAVAGLSRRLGTGEGSTVGGRITLALDPDALSELASGRQIALVSGTNGKTTTTRLLAAALGTGGAVASNSAGANLLPGLVSTLAADPDAPWAALEVDEGLVPKAMKALRPTAVLLLNLSRDQLDRIGEVRLHAQAWRRALEGAPGVTAVANVDDPLVAWAAMGARNVVWVGTGQTWRSDAMSCPECGGRIEWDDETESEDAAGDAEPDAGGPRSVRIWGQMAPSDAHTSKAGDPAAASPSGSEWRCVACGLERPEPHLWLEGDGVAWADGRQLPLQLQLPGWANRANAVMALAGAEALGADSAAAVAAMAEVGTVAGRYQVVDVGGVQVRLVLAKNPAGWAEALDVLRPPPMPVVVGINARVADGRDPSWLWDVPFERLQGRLVVATGERGRDLAVRLRYAGVDHRWAPTYREAVALAAGHPPVPEVELAANYTAFQDARKELAGS